MARDQISWVAGQSGKCLRPELVEREYPELVAIHSASPSEKANLGYASSESRSAARALRQPRSHHR